MNNYTSEDLRKLSKESQNFQEINDAALTCSTLLAREYLN